MVLGRSHESDGSHNNRQVFNWWFIYFHSLVVTYYASIHHLCHNSTHASYKANCCMCRSPHYRDAHWQTLSWGKIRCTTAKQLTQQRTCQTCSPNINQPGETISYFACGESSNTCTHGVHVHRSSSSQLFWDGHKWQLINDRLERVCVCVCARVVVYIWAYHIHYNFCSVCKHIKTIIASWVGKTFPIKHSCICLRCYRYMYW